jgi:hypothetical protein
MIRDAEFLHAPADVALAHVRPFLGHLTRVRGDVRRPAASLGRWGSGHPTAWPLAHEVMLAKNGRWRKPPAVRPTGKKHQCEGDELHDIQRDQARAGKLSLRPLTFDLTSATFTRAGFKVVARGGTNRPIMRYDLKAVRR